MHKAWHSIKQLPYGFARSNIKFEGHTHWTIDDLYPMSSKITGPVAAIKSLRFTLFEVIHQIARSNGPQNWRFESNWVRLQGQSQLSNPSDLPCSLMYSTELLSVFLYLGNDRNLLFQRNFICHENAFLWFHNVSYLIMLYRSYFGMRSNILWAFYTFKMLYVCFNLHVDLPYGIFHTWYLATLLCVLHFVLKWYFHIWSLEDHLKNKQTKNKQTRTFFLIYFLWLWTNFTTNLDVRAECMNTANISSAQNKRYTKTQQYNL